MIIGLILLVVAAGFLLTEGLSLLDELADNTDRPSSWCQCGDPRARDGMAHSRRLCQPLRERIGNPKGLQ